MSEQLHTILNSFEVNQEAVRLSIEARKYAEILDFPLEEDNASRLYFEDSYNFKKRVIDEIESSINIGNEYKRKKLKNLIKIAESEELNNGYLVSQISEDKIVLLRNKNLKPGKVYKVKIDNKEGNLLEAIFLSSISTTSKDKELIDKDFSMGIGDNKYILFNEKGKFKDLISRIDNIRVAVLSNMYGTKKGIYGVKIGGKEIVGEHILYHCKPFKPLDFTPIN